MFIKPVGVGNGIMLCKGYMQYTQGNKYFNWQQQEDILKDGKNNDLPLALGSVSLYPPYAVHSFASQAGVQASLQIF